MKRIRYGIIGFGLFAENSVAPSIQASPNSELVAIQKRSLTEARNHADRLGIPHAYSTPEDLVQCDEVDAVFIASANVAHCRETLAAANARKHVLVEKPMAINASECEQMIEACSAAGVKLMIGQIVRFSPAIVEMKKLVHSGALGRIVSANSEYLISTRTTKRTWFTNRAVAGGGPTFDLGVHCLDTLVYILGDQVAEVRSLCVPRPSPETTENSAALSLRFSGGTVGSIICSFEGHGYRAFVEIIGTEGSVYLEDFTRSNQLVSLVTSRTIGGVVNLDRRAIEVPNLCSDEVTAFSRCILDDLDSPVPGTAGLHHQRVLDLALTGGGILGAGNSGFSATLRK